MGPDLNMIVAVSANWGIGWDGALLFSIPGDMAFFKEKTTGGAVIMGRKTLESLPGGKPLKNRKNIVLSGREDYHPKGVILVKDIESAQEAVRELDPETVFVIGGEAIYRQFLPWCKRAYVTKVLSEPRADCFFPNLDQTPGWKCVFEGEKKAWTGLTYFFTEYENQKCGENL